MAEHNKRHKKKGKSKPHSSTAGRHTKPQKQFKKQMSPRLTAPKGHIIVNGYSEQWLRQQFDWVYHQEVVGVGADVTTGSLVTITNKQGQVLGVGVYAETNQEQEVAVRRFSETVQNLDTSFFVERLALALKRRVIESNTTAWRLVHSENDDLPGIVIDCWDKSVSITLSCVSLKGLLDDLMMALQQVYPFDNAVGHVRLAQGNQEYLGVLKGTFPERFMVQELGIQYWVHPQLSKDAGLFLDMRPLRGWLEQKGWAEQRVLNLFCYTGAFSVSAAVHGAREVVSVDLSSAYLERAQENFRLNGVDVEAHQFVESDTFAALNRLRRKGELFDTVLADPPSFSHSNEGTWSVQKDLKRLVVACLRVVKPGGTLIIATNHGKMPPRDFSKAILDAARKEKRRLRLMLNYVPGTDFPAALHFPEARYLKCWVMEVS